jgi:hypothetical protein
VKRVRAQGWVDDDFGGEEAGCSMRAKPLSKRGGEGHSANKGVKNQRLG